MFPTRPTPETLISHKIMAIEENHAVSDEFRLLRTRIVQRFSQNGWSSLMITGFSAGDGKSTIALNLAITFSKDTSHTTLLVDLDLRKPAIQKTLGLEPEVPGTGLNSYFLGKKSWEEIIIHPGINNLAILPAGSGASPGLEVFGSSLMKTLIKELKGKYGDCFMIFDVPSVSLYPDPLILSEYVDAILLVARRGRIPRGKVKRAISLLPREKLLGIVFNDG
ncbi:MAG: CpsD/CapB family tyrosine-protein kinase [bacterium]